MNFIAFEPLNLPYFRDRHKFAQPTHSILATRLFLINNEKSMDTARIREFTNIPNVEYVARGLKNTSRILPSYSTLYTMDHSRKATLELEYNSRINPNLSLSSPKQFLRQVEKNDKISNVCFSDLEFTLQLATTKQTLFQETGLYRVSSAAVVSLVTNVVLKAQPSFGVTDMQM